MNNVGSIGSKSSKYVPCLFHDRDIRNGQYTAALTSKILLWVVVNDLNVWTRTIVSESALVMTGLQ